MIDIEQFSAARAVFDDHELIYEIDDRDLGLRGFIAIHRGSSLRPAFGATRLWQYADEESALQEVLELSRIMSYKAAMAGIPYGGAKAVLLAPRASLKNKAAYLERYARHVNELAGQFVTGADVGISPEDVQVMKSHSPHIVGVVHDPVAFTAQGLFVSIQAVLQVLFRSTEVRGRSFAIQGLGKIGEGLLRHLYNEDSKIFVADINEARIQQLQQEFPNIIPVSVDNIHTQKVDIFAPCATSHSLNSVTIPELRCLAVVGGANNQLEKFELAQDLHDRGIIYAPDYVVNAGGLISVVSEYDDETISTNEISAKVEKIGSTLLKILEQSKKDGKPPVEVSNARAKEISEAYADTPTPPDTL